MKNSMQVLAMIFALVAVPAAAQQGPAGVPGAPLIGASIAPTPPPVPAAQKAPPRKPAPVNCNKAKDVEQCKARQEARKACKNKKSAERQQCIQDQLQPAK